MPRPSHLLPLALALACAGPHAAPGAAAPVPSAAPPRAGHAAPVAESSAGAHVARPPVAGATALASPVATGMTPDEVRRALGGPQRVDKVPSSTAPGARYERWTYPGREVVFLDGKVIDVVAW